jgi:hypothetical protein
MGEVPYVLSWLSADRWLVEDLFTCHIHGLSAVYRLPTTWLDIRAHTHPHEPSFDHRLAFQGHPHIPHEPRFDYYSSPSLFTITTAITYLLNLPPQPSTQQLNSPTQPSISKPAAKVIVYIF